LIHLNYSQWQGNYHLPPRSDLRWRAFGLLSTYLILGITFLGFSRKPLQVALLIGSGAVLDVLFNGLLKGRKVFPLSAMISCISIAILLNWSFDFHYLFLPVFVCIASKYIFTLDGKHFFNPSLFAICFCILFTGDYISLSPSYQWYGSAQSAWMMAYFVVTGALLLFIFKINRLWLVASFLITFLLQTIIRAYVMKHVIPFETLFIGALTSPALYLFTFYMITDPATSPNNKWEQILVGFSIAVLDLLFHLKFSLYTFFFAGITVAMVRYIYAILKYLRYNSFANYAFNWSKYPVLLLVGLPVLWSFNYHQQQHLSTAAAGMSLSAIPASHSGLTGREGTVVAAVDERLQHVAKWILSVGDAACVADVDNDGLPDLFLTQPLKKEEDQGKLYLNKGDFQFEKVAIPDLEKYIGSPKTHGVPGFAFFMDYDNDGDKDLFVGFGFGKSHLFENRIIPDGKLQFTEIAVPMLKDQHTVCLSANGMDVNNDGKIDLILTNALHQYLPDYGQTKVPLNIFDLPKPEYPGDRRMYHFMHESWHNANNGGLNYLLTNTGDAQVFRLIDQSESLLKETRWSLAVGTMDMNNDGYTDLFIANDFGRDDWYLNDSGKRFVRQQGSFYGDIGLDTYKGMNASIGDIDGNGKEDVYISNVHHEMQAEGSLLWMNYTNDRATTIDFKEGAQRYNLLNANRFGWGAAIGDLDLNGWPDVIQANGMVDDIWDKKWEQPQDFWYYQAQIARTGPEIHSYADNWADIRGCYIYPNEEDRISLNLGEGMFRDATSALGFTHRANTRGVALADFDNDGDLDILVTNQFGDPFLYKNEVTGKKWIGIVPEGNGKNTNRDAVGSKVILRYTKMGKPYTQMREVRLANGFLAMGDNRVLFGLEDGEGISDISLEIHWHNGDRQVLDQLTINRYHKITQE
jgi:enediyne biosynthesis protein E4